ncbi:unnamed protein product [Candida verbasci]|uniref:Triacylglycerol lipase n=1 Tax=Candida verbasci TaxID=1227364 RepID=A0A9W4XES6_9ASCO|nr:unnamed protein product [Candida verbasci]
MILILFYYLLIILASPIGPPTPPGEDEFYNPPEGYENEPNGAILKSRPCPNPLTNIFTPVNVKNCWQFLVRSEDTFNNSNAIVTTIIEPYNADPKKIVSYQVFEDAASENCAPSFSIQFKAPINTISTQAEMYFVIALLNQGYYVNIPDYEGPKSAFTASYQSAYATLNSIKAALASGETTGISEDARCVLWGYSGGSIASVWSSGLISVHSPSILPNIIGVAAGGLVTNITEVAEATDRSAFSGIIANALGGLAKEYEQYADLLNSEINPLLNWKWDRRDKHCLVDALLVFFYDRWFSGPLRFIIPGWDLLTQEPFKSVIDEIDLVSNPNIVPEVPIFIYHGSIDGIVPIPSAIKTFNQWCEAGIASAEFAEDESNGHISEIVVGAPAALTWIINRFNGVEPVNGCVHTKRGDNFEYPGVIPSILDYFKAGLSSLLGFGLGPDITHDQISFSGLQQVENQNLTSN